jgi:hypothetical protein
VDPNQPNEEAETNEDMEQDNRPPSQDRPTLDDPIQGYRHWTHANESQHSLDLHGGPSYMMCLKLPEEPLEGLNLLENLASCFVTDKPFVDAIVGVSTPTSKRKLKRQSSTGSYTPLLPNISSSKPSPQAVQEEWSNKRRKVSMDKLDLGPHAEADDSGLVNESCSTGTASLSQSAMKPSSSEAITTRRAKSYTQLLSKAIANTSLKIAPEKSRTKSQGRTTSVATAEAFSVASPAVTTNSATTQAAAVKGVQKVDRTTLVKQKVKSYPRDREHFYNKVVQPKGAKEGPYFFVLNYNDRLQMVTLCPMAPKGVLSGKRHGRPRYQCVLNATSSNWVTAPTSLYVAVPAFMVMKTPLVAQEAWDILGEP